MKENADIVNVDTVPLKIHQIFFNFDDKTILDFPVFVESQNVLSAMSGCFHTLWSYSDVLHLCKEYYPSLVETFCNLRYPIQQVDLAKYMIGNLYTPCVVCDLDVIPTQHLEKIPGISNRRPFVFDRCSRRSIVANDFFFIRDSHSLDPLFEYFVSNLKRMDSIQAYKTRKMRYVFHTTGPDFWSRFIKQRGWQSYVEALSTRMFADTKQTKRNVYINNAYLIIEHQLSWCPQLQTGVDASIIPQARPEDNKNYVEQELEIHCS